MSATQLFGEIFNALETQQARDFWNGMKREEQNEFVCIAQSKSLTEAVREVEECAKCESL